MKNFWNAPGVRFITSLVVIGFIHNYLYPDSTTWIVAYCAVYYLWWNEQETTKMLENELKNLDARK